MGTGGLRTIRFRGRHWAFSNSYDSYPKGMGKSLVDQIPTKSEEYQEWLKAQRAHWAKWDDLLQEFLIIGPEELAELRLPCAEILTEDRWYEAFDERLESIPPSFHIGTCKFSAEWSYTIDLDRKVFSVDNGAHFWLDRVSQNDDWMMALAEDAEYNRLALPQVVGEDTITNLTIDTEDLAPDTAEYWRTLKPRLVTPDLAHIDSAQITVNRLRWFCFNSFQATEKESLSVTLLGWQAHEVPFREIAYSVLCLAAGGEHLTLVDDQRIFKQAGCAGMLTASDTEAEMELVSSLGAGYHRRGMPTGCAPRDTKYWFEGALVSLVSRLDRPGILAKAVAAVVQYGQKECGRITFNAVLISIEHLVLVKSFQSGAVDHTELLPLIPIALHLSLDARERYGSDYVNAIYSAEVEKTDKQNESENAETSSEGQNTQNDTGAQIGAEDSSSDKAIDDKNEQTVNTNAAMGNEGIKNSGDSGEGKDPGGEKDDEIVTIQENEDEASVSATEWTAYETFKSLIAFFDASVRESLKPTNVDEKGIPTEIYETILSHVSDMQTYNACLKVSRRVRSLCLRRPLIMDNVVFLEPSSGGDEKQFSFTAVEVSVNRPMGVSVSWNPSSWNRPTDCTACHIIVGSEKDRKTCVEEVLVFKGLTVPSEWDCVDLTIGDRDRYSQPASLPESTDKRWNLALERFPVTGASVSRDLEQFWTCVMRSFEVDLKNACYQDWELPPNTKWFLGTHLAGRKNYLNSFHYMVLRMKRASKFSTSLWDEITSEVAASLESLDDSLRAKLPKPPLVQPVGADHPAVLLAVGIEVRLFKWMPTLDEDQVMGGAEKQTSRLVELQPGRVFSPLEEEGRKAITEFLEMAIKHRDERIQKYKDEQVTEAESG